MLLREDNNRLNNRRNADLFPPLTGVEELPFDSTQVWSETNSVYFLVAEAEVEVSSDPKSLGG